MGTLQHIIPFNMQIRPIMLSILKISTKNARSPFFLQQVKTAHELKLKMYTFCDAKYCLSHYKGAVQGRKAAGRSN